MTRFAGLGKRAAQLVGSAALTGAAVKGNELREFRGKIAKEDDQFQQSGGRQGNQSGEEVYVFSRKTDFGWAPLDKALDMMGAHHYWVGTVDPKTKETTHAVGMTAVGGVPFDGQNPDPLFVKTEWASHADQKATWSAPAKDWALLTALAGRPVHVDPERLKATTQEGTPIGRFGRDEVCLTAVLGACIGARQTVEPKPLPTPRANPPPELG